MCVHHFKRLSVYVKDDNVDSTALGSSPKFHWMIEKGMVGLIGWWGCQSAAWHEFVSFLICGHDKETSYFRSNLRSCGHIGCCTDKMGCFFFSACLGFFNFIFCQLYFFVLLCILHVWKSCGIIICWMDFLALWCFIYSIFQACVMTDSYSVLTSFPFPS